MIKRFRDLKIRTQSAIVLLLAIAIAFTLFELLWLNKWKLCETAERLDLFYTQIDDEDFQNALVEKALRYNIPESEEDTEAANALAPFFDLANSYTSIYTYGSDDGLYRAGSYASAMDDDNFRFFFHLGYQLTDGEGESTRNFSLAFANGTAHVVLYNYERVLFVYPFLFACLFLSVSLFISIFLIFLNCRMRQILMLKDEILVMSAGDLTHEIPDLGGNEIGILACELNHLRTSLSDNIRKEEESRSANRDLITALSHDLRTPLTALHGYLEILKLGRAPQSQEEYLNRCLKKTDDIKELTDRMFTYALVAEEAETPDITRLSTDFILQCLQENCDFIRLAGFHPTLALPGTTGMLQGDQIMLKRIFNNIFSNILKYRDKKCPTVVSAAIQDMQFIVSVKNGIKDGFLHTDSHNIGLKNIDRMTELMDGSMNIYQEKELFVMELRFPLQ